jgi:hypothetical protein
MIAATVTNQASEIADIADKLNNDSSSESAMQFANNKKRETSETIEKMTESSELEKPKTTREIVEAYFSDAPIMVDVAYCESRFTQFNADGSVHRGVINPADVGVMQINEKYHLDTAIKLGINVHTLEGNLEYARYLYETQGTAPWEYSSHCWNKKREVALN